MNVCDASPTLIGTKPIPCRKPVCLHRSLPWAVSKVSNAYTSGVHRAGQAGSHFSKTNHSIKKAIEDLPTVLVDVCERLGLSDRSDKMTEAVAKTIIELAQRGSVIRQCYAK
jgi:hypothetical protein